jgi:hypothetical protein
VWAGVVQIKEVASNVSYGLEPFRWQPQALLALQESAEHYLTLLFEDAYVCGSSTIMIRHCCHDALITSSILCS